MSEKDTQDDETQPVRPEPEHQPQPQPEAAPAATARRGFRERFRRLRSSDGNRAYGLAALVASALAGIIVGGLGVATFQAVTDDHDRDRGPWMQRRFVDGDEGFGGRGGMHGRPPGVPGLVPPTTPPEDEGSAG